MHRLINIVIFIFGVSVELLKVRPIYRSSEYASGSEYAFGSESARVTQGSEYA